ncbi:MAG: hypothetical protein J5978_05150 [Spirochaetaceae bacterium]|nr:hypothetical protein [Spirochaetaceae bacterium]
MKKIGSLIITFLILLCIGSCNYGLGSQIDLEAPVISVETMRSGDREVNKSAFAGGIYCNKKVSFYGTAIDNEKVEEVYTEIKWSDESDFHYFMPAKFNGTEWSIDINFEREGTAYLKFVTRDRRKNYGINSTKVITLLVDDTAPVGEAWYIDRKLNGIQYNLKEKEELEKIDLSLSENKDVAQNGNFAIKSSFNDTMGIKQGSIKIAILDENDNKIKEIENNVTSSYAPVFEITHDELVAADSNLNTGKHFLHIQYNAEDIVTVPDSNKAEDVIVEGGWFIWYPESDNPQISTTPTVDENEIINLKVNNTVSITLFDDDEIAEIYCALLKEDEYFEGWETNLSSIKAKIPENDWEKRYFSTTSTGERDKVVNLVAPNEPQKMHLVAWIEEKNGKTEAIDKEVVVTDASTPILYISSPVNNSVPSVNVSNNNQDAIVTVEGQTLDTTECRYLEFVWIPNSVTENMSEKKSKAEDILDNIKTSQDEYAPTSGKSKKTTLQDGVLYSVALTSPEDAGQGFKKQTFSFDVNLFKDFEFNSIDERNEDKYFYVKLTRKDGNITYQEYKLSSDNIKPTITSIAPSTDMQVIDTLQDFTLEFIGTKENQMPMQSYEIWRVDGRPTKLASTNTYTISKDVLEDFAENSTKPTYKFVATDLLGNSSEAQYTIVVSDLPRLSSITSSAPAVCKIGDKIQISANFTDTVSLEGNEIPYLNVEGLSNGETPISKFDYVSGSGTTSLTFEYTVKEGDEAQSISVPTENPINPNGNSGLAETSCHLSTMEEANNLNGKTIKVDGISPEISSIKLSVKAGEENNGIFYARAGKTITASVTATEDIFMDDTPSFLVKVGDQEIELPFEKLSVKTISFSKKIEDTDSNGPVFYNEKTCIKNIEKLKDSSGNPLVKKASNDNDVDGKVTIDTELPNVPSITILASGAEGGKYKTSVEFEINSDVDSLTEYSLDGGTKWNQYVSTVTVNKSSYITARAKDYAGNISEAADVIYLDIKNGFPNYFIECTTPDGNYKTNDKISFTVNLNEDVIIPENCSATLDFTCSDLKTRTATIKTEAGTKNTIEFEYVEEAEDVSYNLTKTVTVNLTGIKDTYGFTQDEKTPNVTYPEDVYISENVKFDTIAPTVISAIPNGGTSAAPSYNSDVNNIYATGNEIKIVFNETVQKGKGNIILRQTAGWAIPPVLTAEEFNIISKKLTYEQKNTLARQDENGYLTIDAVDENLGIKHYNKCYYGTSQYVGPYKLSMMGLTETEDGILPDTSPKYVLDFDIDIVDVMEEGKLKEYKVGTTYKKGATDNSICTSCGKNHAPAKYEYEEPSETVTTQDLRAVLEAAGFHERVLDVTSPLVSVNGKEVIIKFPKGLIGTEELPAGREWELVIEDGAFLDKTGNPFANESEDSVIQINGKDSFFSAGVATPVIRVDRYSYGIGIFQSDENGNRGNQITNENTKPNAGGKPTGYVRVRIDCETKDATIYFDKTITESANEIAKVQIAGDGEISYSYYTKTDFPEMAFPNAEESKKYTSFFAIGSGDYIKAWKGLIVAKATKNNSESTAKEGVFQTVVHFDKPISGGNTTLAGKAIDHLSIRGYTGTSGEGTGISPFPLKDSRVGSPYLRRVYRHDTEDYYWVSYEIPVESLFSMYNYGDGGYFDWGRNWGVMFPGEYTRVENMKGWQ